MAKLSAEEVLLYPLISEDAVGIIEAENKIVFIVNRKATKLDVTEAVEMLYEVGVEKVNMMITPRGLKKAFVKLSSDYKASDLAIKLGVF